MLLDIVGNPEEYRSSILEYSSLSAVDLYLSYNCNYRPNKRRWALSETVEELVKKLIF